jgi:hypothetical protein
MASFKFAGATGAPLNMKISIGNEEVDATGLFSITATRHHTANWPIISVTENASAISTVSKTVYNPWRGELHYAWAFCTFSPAEGSAEVYLEITENGKPLACKDHGNRIVQQVKGRGVLLFSVAQGNSSTIDFEVL